MNQNALLNIIKIMEDLILFDKLCIKENEECPLYNIGIYSKSDDENYIQ